MGNHVPKFDHGQIFIRSEKPFYYSGETVNGYIYLDLARNYPGTHLFLKIKGKEETHWEEEHHHQERDSNGHVHTRTEIRHYNGRNNFYRHKIPIYAGNGHEIPAGQYSFPFSFALGQHLPGSFFDVESRLKAVIKYKIKAELEPHHHKEVKPMKYTQELVINEPLKKDVSQMMGQMSVPVTTWCCINQGNSHIKCYFERNAYNPGETASVICEIDNTNCNLNVTRISTELKMNLHLIANKPHRTKSYVETVARLDMEGLGAHQSAIGEQRRVYSLNLSDHSNKKGLQPSSHGELIKCDYTLVVTAHLDGCTCCSTEPNVNCQIVIVAPPPINYGAVIQPPSWNPAVMPAYNVVFSEAYAYSSPKEAGMDYGPPNLGGQNYGNNPGFQTGQMMDPNMMGHKGY